MFRQLTNEHVYVFVSLLLKTSHRHALKMDSAALAWNLINDAEILSPNASQFDDKYILQLRGIFLSVDVDKRNALHQNQLLQALFLLGLNPTQKLIDSFFKGGSEVVDFSSFVAALYEERRRFVLLRSDIDQLLSFLDPCRTGALSVQLLRNLLVNNDNTFGLSTKEFNNVMRLVPMNKDGTISVDGLRRAMIMEL